MTEKGLGLIMISLSANPISEEKKSDKKRMNDFLFFFRRMTGSKKSTDSMIAAFPRIRKSKPIGPYWICAILLNTKLSRRKDTITSAIPTTIISLFFIQTIFTNNWKAVVLVSMMAVTITPAIITPIRFAIANFLYPNPIK